MRTTLLLLLAAATLQTTELSAQRTKTTIRSSQKETVLLHRNTNGPTTIEINDDGVFLNGEQVATRSDINNRNLNKKIIISDGSDDNATRSYNNNNSTRSYDDYYNSRGGRSSGSGRALLGVFTDARRSGDGAYIQNVAPNSAASAAGLREGDIVTKVDDQSVYSAEDLTRIIRSYSPGDKVTISYNRMGKDRQTTARLVDGREQELPRMPDMMDDDRMNTPPPFPGDEAFGTNRPKLGIVVEEVSGSGVRVKSVREGSVAGAAGLREGDIITYLDDVKVDNVSELQNAVRTLEAGSRVKIEFNRNGSRMSRTVRMSENKDSRDL